MFVLVIVYVYMIRMMVIMQFLLCLEEFKVMGDEFTWVGGSYVET